ncbi:MAG: hypothetical protein E7092_06685, partial [Bacteroidales bacterium]|nr:hypothetical protein [Bacteroidales bacterium]
MKRNFLLSILLTLVAAIGMAQTSTWPITLTTADGLPGKKGPKNYIFESQLFKLDEAISSLRYTVVSTNTVDTLATAYDGMSAGWGPGFPFFSLAEFQILRADGTPIEYFAVSNAEAPNDGSILNLNDGNNANHFHSTYGSIGELPQEYHYIELELSEPVDEFKIRTYTRGRFWKNMPTYVGLTPGGEEYLPYPEQEFSLGEQVVNDYELAEGGFFLIESNVGEYYYEGGERTYPGGGFYYSPYGAHVTPNAASLVYLIPTYEENTYKVAWLNNGHFIKNSKTNRSEWLNWTDNESDAARITFTPCDSLPEDFVMTTNVDGVERTITADALGKMAISVTDSLAVRSRPHAAHFTIWKADVNTNAIKFMLEEAVAEAKERLDLYGCNENYDAGEYDALMAAVAGAEEILANNDASVSDVLNARKGINRLIIPYSMTAIWNYIDSVDRISEAIDNGDIEISCGPEWQEGTYPDGAIDHLYNAIDEALVAAESAGSLADVDEAIATLKAAVAGFWASKVTNVKPFPFRVNQEYGLPGEKINSVWRWESPTYYFSEEVDALRFTVLDTYAKRLFSGSDKPFVCINEFELYNVTGEKIELTENSFETNSVDPGDGQGIAGLVDGNTGNGYHYQSATGDGYDYDGSEYVYLDITLPEPISGFKYVQYGRGNYDAYADVPTDFVFGYYGETVPPDDILIINPNNACVGEKITDVSQITDDGIYAIQGLNNCDPVYGVGDDPQFYNGINKYGKNINSSCAFSIRSAEDGKYVIQSLADGKYWSRQIDEDGWATATSTIYRTQAAEVFIEPRCNDNLPNSFVIYMYNDTVMRDYENVPYVIFQDWTNYLGYGTVSDLSMNNNDGKGEWYIYKMTMDNPYQYWLNNIVAAAESMGYVESNNPGYYKNLGTFPEALAAAQAAVDAKDEAKCKKAIVALNTAIANTETMTPNPVVEGVYIFESAYEEFFNKQGVRKAMCVYPNDGSSSYVESSEKLYWGDLPEGEYYKADDVYKFELISAKESDKVQQWLADSIITPKQAENAYYIKNVAYNVYIGAQDRQSKSMGTTTEPEAVYIIRQQAPAKFDIWNPENYSGYSSLHAESHGLGSGVGGDICYWDASSGQSQWHLRRINHVEAVSIDDLDCTPESQATLLVNMTNTRNVVAFQFDLYLPSGIEIATADGEPMIALSADRVNTHTVTSVKLANGSIRMMAYSNSNAPFSGYEGTIARMTLNIPAAIAYGSYTVQLKNIRIVTEAQEEIRLADATATININKVSGDANGNGTVSISDAVATVNYILGRTPDNFRFEAADTNNDGKISLIDVVNIIDLILNPVAEQQTGRSYKRAATSSETLTADDATSTDGRLALPVAFNNINAYTAVQMDVELPEGATLESATLGDRASSHSVTWSKISDRKARIIAYSLNNATIDGTDGTLLTLN